LQGKEGIARQRYRRAGNTAYPGKLLNIHHSGISIIPGCMARD
jgi:hypothetical protein